MDASQRLPNRLINETSPYLLQHAHNPVDWYPWGPEALERAQAEGKPIFLSIGYAACHWCHVMERESFEDPETAAAMNEQFICIKVDREERPDLDEVYMDAVQAMSGHGGWPMTVFLTPEGFPFYGGTYYPPQDRHGMPGFRRVLQGVAQAWTGRREEIGRQGRELVDALVARTTPRPSREPLTSSVLTQATTQLARNFDDNHGGFGAAPKFPQPPVIELLLRLWARGSPRAGEMAEVTLRAMALGGIYDQIGGGFHRYSVDRIWLVPHFEKMLYDNAQLARVYTHAWQARKEPLYKRIAIETLEYLLRDMRDPEGGMYSTEDADSEGVEGKFYVWPYEEFMAVAPEAEGYYGVSRGGNFEGATILTAASEDPPGEARARLLAARSSRIRPARDDKVLASWNGLAIGALAEAGAAFRRPDLVTAAEETAAFVLDSLRNEAGRLLHAYKDGQAKVPGLLEDYAYLGDGLFALWEVTFEPRWIEECERLCSQMLDLFWDPTDGGFYTTGKDHERLVLRKKDIVESVTPSPNAVASLLLQRLSLVSGKVEYSRRGAEVLRLAHELMGRVPQGVATSLSSLDLWLSTAKEIVVVGDRSHREARALLDEIWSRYLPNKVVAGAPPGIDSPLLEGKTALDGLPTAFVCENYACQAPTTDPRQLADQLA